MHQFIIRVIELTVPDPGSSRHVLYIAAFHNCAIAHAVFMFQRALDDVGDYFHIAVRVRAEALPRFDPVFVNNTQTGESHVGRIVILTE